MNPSELLLAIRVADVEFALQAARVYRLGSGPQCDLRLKGSGVAAVALSIRLHDGVALVTATGQDHPVALRCGGSARLAGIELHVVADLGNAVILPDPAMPPRGPATAAPPLAAPVAAPRLDVGVPAGRTFTELMAHELRRTPWFALSLLLHALALWFAWFLFGGLEPEPEPATRYGFQSELGPVGDAPEGPDEMPVEREPTDTLEPSLDESSASPKESAATEPAPAEIVHDEPLLQIGGERIVRRAGAGSDTGTSNSTGNGTGSGDPLTSGGGSGGFRRTVADLRKSGLEIVFVFDSTGSMGSSISATKNGIAAMLDLLRALVPDARFSLVTYRDKGPGEEYLVRSLPLGRDFFAATNFMQTISADGGGDTPEAVLAGLRAAFEQPWQPGARRVVVLAGDAPPHPRELRTVLDHVRRFTNVTGSSVHTLLTNGERSGAAESFARIAQLGRGLCCPIADQQRLLRKVLALAFGNEFEQDIDAVLQQLDGDRDSPPTWARDLARRGGPDLLAALDVEVVPSALIHALLRKPSRAVLDELVRALASNSLGAPARNAAAHVLREALDLDAAPVDPQHPKVLGQTEAAALRKQIAQLPD